MRRKEKQEEDTRLVAGFNPATLICKF